MIVPMGKGSRWVDAKGVANVLMHVHFHSNGHFIPNDEKGPDEWCDERTIDKITLDNGSALPAEVVAQISDLLLPYVNDEPLDVAA